MRIKETEAIGFPRASVFYSLLILVMRRMTESVNVFTRLLNVGMLIPLVIFVLLPLK